MPFRITARSVGAFLVKFAIAYGVAMALYLTQPGFNAVHGVVLATATVALDLVGGEVSHQLHLHTDRTIHVRARAGGVQKDFDIGGFYGSNLAVFVALLLASPGLTWRTRATAFVAGSTVIFAINTLVMLGTMWIFEERYAALAPLLPHGPVAVVARLAHELSPTGGLYMLPVFLWGFVLMSPLLAPRARPHGKVARNALCPCGSGQKYKVCCGR